MGALIYFFPNHADIDVRIESRENRTPAQNGRLHWVGGKHNPTPVYFAGVGIGRFFEGGAYFKFWPIRGALIRCVCLCVRGGGWSSYDKQGHIPSGETCCAQHSNKLRQSEGHLPPPPTRIKNYP